EAYTQMNIESQKGLLATAGIDLTDKASKDYFKSVKDLLLSDEPLRAGSMPLIALPGATDEQAVSLSAALYANVTAFAQSSKTMIDDYRDAIGRSTKMFWAMALLVGTVQGGIQAVSRSYFGKLVPKKRSNEYFGFFDIFGKFATFIGPLLYAIIGSMTGRSSLGTLALLALFMIGFIVLIIAKKPLEELEARKALEV
ncbi:MAG: MFS transporter, partial [Clostridiales bacterium]|nr:MFS transporter [Clostridiales bacterium]